MGIVGALIYFFPFALGLITLIVFMAIFSKVKNNLLTVLIFSTVIITGMVGALFSGRDLSSSATTADVFNYHQQNSIWLLAQRAANAAALCASVAYILTNLPNGLTRIRLNVLVLFYTLYFVTNYILSGIFGIFPAFDYRWLYPFLVTCAYCLAPDTTPNTFLKFCVVGVLVTCAVSLVSIAVVPAISLQSEYKEGLISWLPIRFWGLTPHPNMFGPMVGVAILVLVLRPMFGRFRALALVVLIVCLVLAQSKTAIIAIAFVLVCRWLPSSLRSISQALSPTAEGTVVTRGVLSLLGLTVTLVGSGVIFGLVMNGVLSFDGDVENVGLSTFTGRSLIWQITLQTWKQNIAFGYGPDLWSIAFRSKAGLMAVGQAHNQWLQTLGQGGILGSLGLGAYVITLVVVAIRQHKASGGLAILMVGYLLAQTFTEAPFRITSLLELSFLKHFVVIGYLASLERWRPTSPSEQSR